jgi:hypothetical protein
VDCADSLAQARLSIATATRRAADLVASAGDLSVLAHGSEWTLQQVAAHLTVGPGGLYPAMATGAPSPIASLDPADVRSSIEALMVDVPETDPVKLSRLMVDALEEFLDVVGDRPGDDPVTFHGGVPYTLAGLAGLDTETVFGPLHFDEAGRNTSKTMSAVQIQDGKVVTVWPVGPGVGSLRWPARPAAAG